MTNWDSSNVEDHNMLNKLQPHRDKIVGLDEKRQPKHIHTDEKSYEDRNEQIPVELMQDKNQTTIENLKNVPSKEKPINETQTTGKEQEKNIPSKENPETQLTGEEKAKNVLEKAKDVVVEGFSSMGEKIKNIFT